MPTIGFDWLPSISRAGWSIMLRKLDRTVRQAVNPCNHGRTTLVCHSAGGLIARLYVSGQPVLRRTYPGHEHVERLITLGSPHYHHDCRRTHGGMLSCFTNDLAPGAFSPQVTYASVAGKLVQGDPRGTFAERTAHNFYRRLTGDDGAVWGDGLVPLSSALLEGAQHVILNAVGHAPGFRSQWYGSPGVAAQWWWKVAAPQGRDDPEKT